MRGRHLQLVHLVDLGSTDLRSWCSGKPVKVRHCPATVGVRSQELTQVGRPRRDRSKNPSWKAGSGQSVRTGSAMRLRSNERDPMRSPHRFGIGLIALIFAAFGAGCGCASTPPPPPPGPHTCVPAAAGQIQVAVVVDASMLPNGAKNASVTCVNLPKRSNGIDALNARARRLGVAKPRFDQSGLLCAIDGTPRAPACGDKGPDGYKYWGYYGGGTRWTFANQGPSSRALTNKSVEGWAFQNGSMVGPPRTSATFATLTKR